MSVDINKIRKLISDLELKRALKQRELDEAKKNLKSCQEKVQEAFGTTDPTELRKKVEEVEARMESSITTLRSMGVEI